MTISKSKTYVFHQDPGHGWLAVKMKELIELDIADKVSCFSYQKGQTVYLEEDSDMTLFINAKKAKGIEIAYRASHLDKTPIRYYSHYNTPTKLAQALEKFDPAVHSGEVMSFNPIGKEII